MLVRVVELTAKGLKNNSKNRGLTSVLYRKVNVSVHENGGRVLNYTLRGWGFNSFVVLYEYICTIEVNLLSTEITIIIIIINTNTITIVIIIALFSSLTHRYN